MQDFCVKILLRKVFQKSHCGINNLLYICISVVIKLLV